MKTLIASAASLLLGLGLGWLLFHGDTVVQNVEPKVVEPAAPAAERIRVIERDAPRAAAGVGAPAPGAAPAAPGGSAKPEEEVAALRARVGELERQLESELLATRAKEGAPVNVPPGLPPRFRDEQQLVSTFNAALQEAGFPGQVTSVDCTEHPCIVFGTGFGDRGDMQKLLSSSAMEAYKDDSMSTFGFQRGPDNGEATDRFFGVAVMPSGSEAPEDLKKRINFRVRQMAELSRP